MDTIDWLLRTRPSAGRRCASHAKELAPKFSSARDRTARGTGPAPPSGCRPSTRCSSCVRPAWTTQNLPSVRRLHASRQASGGTRSSARSRSSRVRWSRASTGARSRSAPTSDARRRASHAVSSPSNWTTAVGTAKLRRARARHSTPRSACWRVCSSTSVPSGLRRRLRRPDGEAREYLLERGLFRRRSTGEVANPAFLEFAFPPRYH
jgi:hypothetical protein